MYRFRLLVSSECPQCDELKARIGELYVVLNELFDVETFEDKVVWQCWDIKTLDGLTELSYYGKYGVDSVPTLLVFQGEDMEKPMMVLSGNIDKIMDGLMERKVDVI